MLQAWVRLRTTSESQNRKEVTLNAASLDATGLGSSSVECAILDAACVVVAGLDAASQSTANLSRSPRMYSVIKEVRNVEPGTPVRVCGLGDPL